jgi:23S rRNA (uracil1939-C5)-methyltransferase
VFCLNIWAANISIFAAFMGRRKAKLPLLTGLEITDAGAEGKAIGRVENRVVFVPYVVPGDVISAQVIRKRKNYFEASLTELEKVSDKRTEPVCEHFGVCGGCKWQNTQYKFQLEHKQQQVEDHLNRIGKIDLPPTQPIVAAPETEFYRNKLEFTFSANRWLTQEEIQSEEEFERRGVGFHIPGKFDKVLDLNKCHLMANPANAIRDAIKEFALKSDLTFFNLREQTGLFRNLIIRNSNTEEVMVLLSFGEDDPKAIAQVMEFLKNEFPEINSLLYVINLKRNDTIYDQDVICYSGNPYIVQELEGIKFKVGPKSFFQTNSQQALTLYEITREYAAIKPSDTVYDLYTGTGTIANFVAKGAKQVIGIESVPEAIEDAKENSKENGITNTSFFAGDMKDLLTSEFIAEHGRPDVLITDPPRAGMHQDVVMRILECEPKRIVYVSCNAATQARDLQLLDAKYKVTKVQPIDMFPHTHHVENVALLELK